MPNEPASPDLWCRCYDCGQLALIKEARRRDVKTGTVAGVAGDFSQLSNWFWGGVRQRVDLCPKCAARRDATDRMQLGALLVFLLVALLIFLVLLMLAALGILR